MTDRRSEVPVWAYLNAQIVQEAVRAGDLDRAIRKAEQSRDLPANSLRVINLAHVLSLLYCLIVVPKQLWARSRLPVALSRLDTAWLLGLVSIELRSPLFESDPVNQLFRHLRNAVAHVRFEVNEQGDFTFWDQKDETSPQNFRATFSQTSLEQFLSKVGPLLADLHFEKLDDEGRTHLWPE